jgi:hypothetical protein
MQHMLLITIDIVSGGYAVRRKNIATMKIGNITNLADISDYVVDGLETENALVGTGQRSTRTFVKGHDRRQSVWPLIAKAADALAGAEFDES